MVTFKDSFGITRGIEFIIGDRWVNLVLHTPDKTKYADNIQMPLESFKQLIEEVNNAKPM